MNVNIGTRDGSVYTGAAGRRPADGGAAFTPDTVVWLASLTELVTEIAALQLVERGVIDLDTPVGEYLPEIDVVDLAPPLERDGVGEDLVEVLDVEVFLGELVQSLASSVYPGRC